MKAETGSHPKKPEKTPPANPSLCGIQALPRGVHGRSESGAKKRPLLLRLLLRRMVTRPIVKSEGGWFRLEDVSMK